MVPPEERERQGMVDPMCEAFPKQVACYYSRFGMGGGVDSRHAMCILGHNMINDKVFLLVWIWHAFLILIGVLRVSTRSSQLSSAKVRYFLMKVKMNRYFRNNAHLKHIRHYIYHCSIGDWFVLYQMSKNIPNKRFFAEFLALLAMTVDPDPNITPEEPEIHLTPEEIEKIKSSGSSDDSSKKKSSANSSDNEEEEEGEKKASVFSKVGGEFELDTSYEASAGSGGGGSSLSGKQRMLIKLGKHAKSANKNAMMAAAAMKRSRRK